ncbi:MAG: RNA 2',3'-cyclic phosphodiesterase [Verrucomicrobiales bacterium]|nr:RNA 2',3'-cyclic phosphodiesterase [Verrucomicrobiales bacterium]
MKTRRLFVALWPTEALVRSVGEIREAARMRLPRGVARYVADDQLHLTLRFLGEVGDDAVAPLWAAIAGRLGRPASLALNLHRWGVFPGIGRPRVLWAGLSGDLESLVRLQSEVSKAADAVLGTPKRPVAEFHPHLTVARLRDMGRAEASRVAEVLADLDRRGYPPTNWCPSEVRLMRSDLGPNGPRYHVEAEIPFENTSNPGGKEAG